MTEATTFGEFVARHVGLDTDEQAHMLAAVGHSSLHDLAIAAVPDSIRLPFTEQATLAVPDAITEEDVLGALRELAGTNTVKASMIGLGYHETITPGVVRRKVLENPGWYTAYTPYQPEISQGRLEALLNFQTVISDLTGLDIANASLLDESTAVAEAVTLMRRSVRAMPEAQVLLDAECLPQTIAVVRTRCEALGIDVEVCDLTGDLPDGDVFGVVVQYPGASGRVHSRAHYEALVAAAHARGALVTAAADLLACVVLTAPGEWGADVAVGSAQRFGVPMSFGGPHAGFISVRSGLERAMPGRLVGVSVDAAGNPAYRLALQTREQHIRREKATSNICTAQVLLAVIASMYAVYHGPEGLTAIARSVHRRTAVLAAGLRKLGFAPQSEAFFDTVTVDPGSRRNEIAARARAERINLRIGERTLGVALDETTTPDIVEAVWRAFGGRLVYADVEAGARDALPVELKRSKAFLTHPVFHAHRSETELLRYMRKLSDRDLALDRAMIPLGSCTMKLNATSEMIPLTWPAFANLHPFAPRAQAAGYHALFKRLEQWLCDITGYDAISLQPNSGAQGEYAGLLAIRGYHTARGEPHRKVCLIPSSAHGTNPASASMTGMEVVVVACDGRGDVDVNDLTAKAAQHSKNLAAVMITYPSTHGVFEEHIRDICDVVHGHGGQVYLDGANMNAQVGLSRPGDYGADVSHLNLHKTFCIPHGGGGPGMGPIGVKAHLKPFLPSHALPSLALPSHAAGCHPASDGAAAHTIGPVSAAPFGSASILTISYIYILMMGGEGLQRATEIAILNANYIASRLAAHFPVLYRNARGRVAHECIVDPRALKTACGVTVDDIAKRLFECGFHAPTMSFPVKGTLM